LEIRKNHLGRRFLEGDAFTGKSYYISNYTSIADIKRVMSTIEAARRYIPELVLKLKGHKYWACCPLHSEKTPSFMIDLTKDRWKCFGCQEGGDSIDLVAKVLGLGIVDAAKRIAEDLGLIGVENSTEWQERRNRWNEKEKQRALVQEYEKNVCQSYNGLRNMMKICKYKLSVLTSEDIDKSETAELIELYGSLDILFDMLLDEDLKNQVWAVAQYGKLVG